MALGRPLGRVLGRVLRHFLLPAWWVRRHFSAADLRAIEAAVANSEAQHRGELRFVVEGPLHPLAVLRGLSPRQRAMELFSQLRVWDTAENSGVLIYVQLVDHKVEVLADRGINALVPQVAWDDLCRQMEQAFRQGCYGAGSLQALQGASSLLAAHFPAMGAHSNELPDAPLVL